MEADRLWLNISHLAPHDRFTCLTLFIPMDFPLHVYSKSMEFPILYSKGSKAYFCPWRSSLFAKVTVYRFSEWKGLKSVFMHYVISTIISWAVPNIRYFWSCTCTHKFLAAPKPPGNITASKLSAVSLDKGSIFPRAILADSSRTFLENNNVADTKPSEPRWLTWV